MDAKVEISGPWWPHYRVNVGGFQVPYLTVAPPMDANLKPAPLDDSKVFLSCDRRIGIYTTREELERWLPFLADCMAVAAGYPCLGATEKMNPFANKAPTGLGAIEPEKPHLSVIDGDLKA
jgi:hypothetical protein